MSIWTKLFGRQATTKGTDPRLIPEESTPTVQTYNHAVSLFHNGKYSEARGLFESCLNENDLKLQAAYASGLCQRELGQQVQLPSGLAEQGEEAGSTYVASNLVCYLVQQGHQAALQAYGDSKKTWNVVASVEGADYILQISGSFGGFSNWAWRKQSGKDIALADRDANPRPTKTDQLVLAWVSKASSLPMAPIPSGGLPMKRS